jgi:hypothetical protein
MAPANSVYNFVSDCGGGFLLLAIDGGEVDGSRRVFDFLFRRGLTIAAHHGMFRMFALSAFRLFSGPRSSGTAFYCLRLFKRRA